MISFGRLRNSMQVNAWATIGSRVNIIEVGIPWAYVRKGGTMAKT